MLKSLEDALDVSFPEDVLLEEELFNAAFLACALAVEGIAAEFTFGRYAAPAKLAPRDGLTPTEAPREEYSPPGKT